MDYNDLADMISKMTPKQRNQIVYFAEPYDSGCCHEVVLIISNQNINSEWGEDDEDGGSETVVSAGMPVLI